MVKFLSVDTEMRVATFDVDGVQVTRNIPNSFEGTIDDYLIALAEGLAIEFTDEAAKEIGTVTISSGEELA